MLDILQGKNNRKLGEGLITESRPVGWTCPPGCALLGICYSQRLCGRRKNIAQGMIDRSVEWETDRARWVEHRIAAWRKAKESGQALRLLVNGDLCLPDGSGSIDWDWVSDVCTAVKASGIKAWGYTHAWKALGASGASQFKEAGIVMYASIHSSQDAKDAASKGFPLALVRGTQWVGRLDDFSFAPCAHQTKGTKCSHCQTCRRGQNVQFLPH